MEPLILVGGGMKIVDGGMKIVDVVFVNDRYPVHLR